MDRIKMNKSQKEHKLTPSEFYRKIRPEYFSDSIKVYKAELPKEQCEYILSQISVDQKHDSFETLARKLAERFVVPNLIPQVGPTGGGDGKTDTETYPVSNEISERWFVPENGWNENQKWAFAISAKTDWKSKIKEDVKKIIETNREYTKIYFISNQKISSKQRQDTQDLLRKEFKISINILDGVWIIDKIYSNDLINLVVETLHLSALYKQEVKKGSNDTDKLKILEDLETKIANPHRYFEYDYQLVEDMLESAILTRMLEKSKDEVIGKFDRALRIAKKINNEQQLLRIYYQRAWTYINWYDDYSNYFQDFNEIEEKVKLQPTIFGIELYFNLLNILKGIVLNQHLYSDKLEYYTKVFIDLLNKCIEDNSKPCRSLIAKTYKSFLSISDGVLNNKDISSELTNLKDFFEQGVNYFEYPFEVFKQIIETFGDVLPNNKEYDNLIDSIAIIVGKKRSELDTGRIFLYRGFQKLEKNFYKESIIYFGKAVLKISRESNKEELFFCLIGLSEAYKNIGLLWASNNTLITATTIYINDFYNYGKINKRLIDCLKNLLNNELIIGRIPYILNWYKLISILSSHMKIENLNNFLVQIDACLSIRLLNIPYQYWRNLSYLPEIFHKYSFFMSEDTVFFMLGYLENLEEKCIKELNIGENLDECYSNLANQPAKKQMLYKTDLLNESNLEFNSIVLGVKIDIVFKKNTELVIFAEMILAYIESFFATSFKNVYPSTEKIIIELVDSSYVDNYKIVPIDDSYSIRLCINIINIDFADQENIYKMLAELISYLIHNKFMVPNSVEYLKKLFEDQELHERQYMIYTHRQNLLNILPDSTMILFDNFLKENTLKEFKMKRLQEPNLKCNIEVKKETNKTIFENTDNFKHNQMKVYSIIDIDLWDKAKWKGFGVVVTQNSLYLYIGFQNGNFGKKIFENWIKRFGKEDKNEEIRISIIKGINISRPDDYRVHITKNINAGKISNGMYISNSRIHELNPQTSRNLDEIIKKYDSLKKYVIVPAQFDGKTQPIIYFESAIFKSNLIIKNAWEIGEHDMDCVVIRKDDNPIVPDNAIEIPIKKLLKRLNAKKETL